MRWPLLLIFILLYIILGYLREEYFVQTNFWLGYLWSKDSTYEPILKYRPFFRLFDYYPLYYTKFIATLLFTILFYYLSRAFLINVPHTRQLLGVLKQIYLLLFSIACVLFAGSWFTEVVHAIYPVSRFLIGILHSPLPVIVLFLSPHVSQKSN